MGHFVQDGFGSDEGKMIIDPFASGHIPFQEPNQGTPAAQVCRQLRPGDAHKIFCDRIRVVRDHDATTFPGNPVEIRDSSLYVQPAAVRPDRFADRSAPVVDTGNAERQEPGPARRAVICQAP
jgi:hypothetical protein